ncbi:MAG TPA: HlyD family type I secretion periplasmic adaptor subunit [Acetobacteraceae bacterium]|nr:HlyD family type I secretion periplasmic adaptor subunit [Acetobacteraceae bacterium]
MARNTETEGKALALAPARPALSLVRRNRDVATSERALLEFESPSETLIALPAHGPARINVYVVGLMFAAFLAVACLVPMDIIVTAQGTTMALNSTVVLQPLETAIVREIDVREGQVVHKGQILAKLDPTFAASDEKQYQDLVDKDRAEIARLTAELEEKPFHPEASTQAMLISATLYAQRQAQLAAQLSEYDQKISTAKAQEAQAEADIQGYRQRLSLAATVEDKRRELERLQVGSVLDLLSAMDQRVEMERSLGDAIAQKAQAEHTIAATEYDRKQWLEQWRGQISQDLRDDRASLANDLDNLEKDRLRHQMVTLRADQDAIVLTVARVSLGSIMQSGDQLITMVPVDAPLEVEADVDADDAGFVRVGQSAYIMLNTFPFVHYGYIKGTVRLVSPDSFDASSGPTSTLPSGVSTSANTTSANVSNPANDTTTFYRTRVTMDENGLHNIPPGFRMVPGMPVTTDIKVGTRTMIQYIMERVIPTFETGMREPP